MEEHEAILRKLTIRDDAYVDSLLADRGDHRGRFELSDKACSLVRIGALAAMDATTPSYLEAVESARDVGATVGEIVDVLIAIMPAVGVARVVSAAPRLALALGYDVGEALELHDE